MQRYCQLKAAKYATKQLKTKENLGKILVLIDQMKELYPQVVYYSNAYFMKIWNQQKIQYVTLAILYAHFVIPGRI